MNYKQLLPKLKYVQQVDNALVSTLYILSKKSQITTAGFAVLITVFLYSQLTYYIVIWGSILGAVTLFRLYNIYLFKTNPQKYTLEVWYKKFMVLALLTASIVSLLGIVFIHFLGEYYQMFILATLLGAAAVATTSLSSDFRLAIVYISIVLVPVIVSSTIIQTPLHLILSVLLTLFFLSQISMILNNHRQDEKIKKLHEEIKNQIEHNQLLLDENKQFIADMVHQIRTPLTVIMTNSSLIEMQSELRVSSYVTQINSAINMLSNSSHFINERIHFFEVIAKANNKTIHANIANDVIITMNDTELERLIDNNLSNAIKHSSDKSEIEIVLEKDHLEIVLKFISKGKKISDVSMIFDKKKTICKTNSIDYSAHSEKGINTFTYVFKV